MAVAVQSECYLNPSYSMSVLTETKTNKCSLLQLANNAIN